MPRQNSFEQVCNVLEVHASQDDHETVFLGKMLGTRYGSVGTRFL